MSEKEHIEPGKQEEIKHFMCGYFNRIFQSDSAIIGNNNISIIDFFLSIRQT